MCIYDVCVYIMYIYSPLSASVNTSLLAQNHMSTNTYGDNHAGIWIEYGWEQSNSGLNLKFSGQSNSSILWSMSLPLALMSVSQSVPMCLT